MSSLPLALTSTISSIRKTKQAVVGTAPSIDSVLPIILSDVKKDLRRAVPFWEKRIREMLQRLIPVRTGKLLDTMLKNLGVELIGDTLHISTVLPTGYPIRIENPKHFGEIGYGPKYEPTNPIPNRVVFRETKKGAYYFLNDPMAESDYITAFSIYAFPIIRDSLQLFLSDYEVTVYLPKEKPEGTSFEKVSEGPSFEDELLQDSDVDLFFLTEKLAMDDIIASAEFDEFVVSDGFAETVIGESPKYKLYAKITKKMFTSEELEDYYDQIIDRIKKSLSRYGL